jgi:hypothetical protein
MEKSSDYIQAEWELYHLKLVSQIRGEMERTAEAAQLLTKHLRAQNRLLRENNELRGKESEL